MLTPMLSMQRCRLAVWLLAAIAASGALAAGRADGRPEPGPGAASAPVCAAAAASSAGANVKVKLDTEKGKGCPAPPVAEGASAPGRH
jgi:hypothetical protein